MAEKILIVDDDLDTLRLVGLMLQRQGYEIAAASSGQQALMMAQGDQPALILLDVMMPDLDGVEVTRRLRSNPATRGIPVIMFTAKSQVEDKILGFEAGADDYLTKPTQPRELFAHVKAVLARINKSRSSTRTMEERGLVVGVLAARGGLGVSTLVLNLGFTLRNQTKKEVLVADFRPGQGTIGMELGYLRPEGLNRLLQRKPVELDGNVVEDELTQHPSGLRLLLSSAQPRDAQFSSAVSTFEVITKHLSYLACFLLIDLGTSLTPLNEKVIQQCDELLVVVEAVPQTVVQTRALLEDLRQLGVSDNHISVVLINRIRSGMQLSWSQVQEQLGRSIGIIFTPAPELAYQATLNNVPMVVSQPDSLTAQQFAKLADKVSQRRPG